MPTLHEEVVVLVTACAGVLCEELSVDMLIDKSRYAKTVEGVNGTDGTRERGSLGGRRNSLTLPTCYSSRYRPQPLVILGIT